MEELGLEQNDDGDEKEETDGGVVDNMTCDPWRGANLEDFRLEQNSVGDRDDVYGAEGEEIALKTDDGTVDRMTNNNDAVAHVAATIQPPPDITGKGKGILSEVAGDFGSAMMPFTVATAPTWDQRKGKALEGWSGRSDDSMTPSFPSSEPRFSLAPRKKAIFDMVDQMKAFAAATQSLRQKGKGRGKGAEDGSSFTDSNMVSSSIASSTILGGSSSSGSSTASIRCSTASSTGVAESGMVDNYGSDNVGDVSTPAAPPRQLQWRVGLGKGSNPLLNDPLLKDITDKMAGASRAPSATDIKREIRHFLSKDKMELGKEGPCTIPSTAGEMIMHPHEETPKDEPQPQIVQGYGTDDEDNTVGKEQFKEGPTQALTAGALIPHPSQSPVPVFPTAPTATMGEAFPVMSSPILVSWGQPTSPQALAQAFTVAPTTSPGDAIPVLAAAPTAALGEAFSGGMLAPAPAFTTTVVINGSIFTAVPVVASQQWLGVEGLAAAAATPQPFVAAAETSQPFATVASQPHLGVEGFAAAAWGPGLSTSPPPPLSDISGKRKLDNADDGMPEWKRLRWQREKQTRQYVTAQAPWKRAAALAQGPPEAQRRATSPEDLHRAAIAQKEETLGVDHPETLICVSNLACFLKEQNRIVEATTLYRRILAGRLQVLGADHPSTLVTWYNLGSILEGQEGCAEEAEAFYRSALAGQKRVLGAAHSSTFETAKDLGRLLERQSKVKDAEEFYREAITDQEAVVGAEHPNTLTFVYALAELVSKQGRVEEAVLLFRRVLAVQEKVLGAEHPSTLTTVQTLEHLGHLLEGGGQAAVSRASILSPPLVPPLPPPINGHPRSGLHIMGWWSLVPGSRALGALESLSDGYQI